MKKIALNIWPIIIAIVSFTLISFLVQTFLPFLQASIAASSIGMSLYLLISFLMVIIPFASPTALVPLASALWGWQVAGVLTFLTWLLASQLLFEVAKRFGKKLVLQLVPYKTLKNVVQFLESMGVAGIVLVRAFVPSDVSSYSLALFTSISRLKFFMISIGGLFIPAFMYAYVGSLPFIQQIALILIGCAILAVYFVLHKRSVAKNAYHSKKNALILS